MPHFKKLNTSGEHSLMSKAKDESPTPPTLIIGYSVISEFTQNLHLWSAAFCHKNPSTLAFRP
jgi:hypothetical protein